MRLVGSHCDFLGKTEEFFVYGMEPIVWPVQERPTEEEMVLAYLHLTTFLHRLQFIQTGQKPGIMRLMPSLSAHSNTKQKQSQSLKNLPRER